MVQSAPTDLLESLPRYQRIKHDVKQRIESGDLRPGEQTPTELELAEQYEVNRLTVNKALSQLVQEDYLYRERGRGTFVKRREPKAGPVIHVVAMRPTLFSPFTHSLDWFMDYNIFSGVVEACKELRCQMRFLDWSTGELPSASDGVKPSVVLMSMNLKVVGALQSSGCTVAVSYYPVPEGTCSNVITDWEGAMYDATTHLVRLGHERIALLAGESARDPKQKSRIEGYARAVEEHGRLDRDLMAVTGAGFEDVREAVGRLLARSARPTALEEARRAW